MLVEGILADTTGNKARCEQMYRQILGILPSHSPRRKFHVWEYAMMLAQQGRATECQNEIKELSWQCNARFTLTRVAMIQFVDAVETGRVRDASLLLPEITGNPLQIRELSRMPTKYQSLLKIMHEVTGARQTHLELPGLAHESQPTWLKVVRHLLKKETDEALRLARLDADKMMGSIFSTGFDSFNLIRAELSAGKQEGAARLIKLRQERGNKNYLDDFFLARAELIGGNRKLAAKHFAALLDAVDFYHAKGRLDFEMMISCEIAHGDILELTRAADSIRQREKETRQERPAAAMTAIPPLVNEPEGADGRPPQQVIVGRSAAIAEIRQAVSRFAGLDAPVLISGETGTGKDLIAKSLHESSKRKDRPLIPVNCGSISETLLESELFGHERGSFTGADRAHKGLFEEAGDGTIFLDEIGDISPHLQSALLRVLETGEIRAVGSTKTRKIECRIIAATNADLNQLSEQGMFRKDLLFRLQRLGIYIPPLRDRRDDILLLARHFLDIGRPVGIHAVLTQKASEAIRAYDWPGNVRELRNVIERMRLLHSDKLLYEIEDLEFKFHSMRTTVVAPLPSAVPAASAQMPRPLPEEFTPRNGASPVAATEPDRTRTAAEKPAPGPGDNLKDFLRQGTSHIRRLDKVRELFAEHRKLTRGEIILILGVSPNTATKDLQVLCDEGFIERVEPSVSTRSHYFILKNRPEPPAGPVHVEPNEHTTSNVQRSTSKEI